MHKRKAHISALEGEPHLLLNSMKDFGRFLDIYKYNNANLFKEMVEQMKEGDCVC